MIIYSLEHLSEGISEKRRCKASVRGTYPSPGVVPGVRAGHG